MAFKIGDLVQLKGGGPIMTVTGSGSDGQGRPQFTCSWFDGQDKPQTNVYPVDALKGYREERSASPVDDNG